MAPALARCCSPLGRTAQAAHRSTK
jgi:hypothetical protein